MGVVGGIVKGETTPEELIRYVHGRITNKYKDKIKASLTGVVSETDRFILNKTSKSMSL